jgi:hypothetical protein
VKKVSGRPCRAFFEVKKVVGRLCRAFPGRKKCPADSAERFHNCKKQRKFEKIKEQDNETEI